MWKLILSNGDNLDITEEEMKGVVIEIKKNEKIAKVQGNIINLEHIISIVKLK